MREMREKCISFYKVDLVLFLSGEGCVLFFVEFFFDEVSQEKKKRKEWRFFPPFFL